MQGAAVHYAGSPVRPNARETDMHTHTRTNFWRRPASLLAAAALFAVPHVATAQSTIPARLSDKEIWQLNADFSEAGGYFRSDNLLSNETGFQAVIPYLRSVIKPGGVYLGVGPEQNFTYIVSLQPKIAFIFDIRRGNMVEHLMYKALLETSADRADFLSKLFSRPRPAGLDTNSTPQKLFEAYAAAAPDSNMWKRNFAAIKEHLASHGFVMGDSDVKTLEYIYSQFYDAGPQINYNFSSGGGGGFGRGGMPTYATLQQATDTSREELGLSRHRGELPLAQGFRDEEPARAGRRQLRRTESDPRRRPVPQGPSRGRVRVLHVQRRAVSVSAGRRVVALL